MISNHKRARCRHWLARGFGRKDAAALAGVSLAELREALRRRTAAERENDHSLFREAVNVTKRRRYAERFGRVRSSRYHKVVA